MASEIFLDDIRLNRSNNEALHAQLARELRRLIVRKSLVAGQRMPATRTCAKTLGVGRNVVAEAYDTLISEGLLEARQGSGTFVCSGDTVHTSADVFAAPVMRHRVSALHGTEYCGQPNTALSFVPGVPALSHFPLDGWARATSKAMRVSNPTYLADNDARGLLTLREAIAGHVGPSRGIACDPGQVIVLTGARQAFEIAIRLLTEPEETVFVEDPGYVEARAVAVGLGRAVVGCPLSSDGVVVPDNLSRGSLLIVTPAHQYPTGVRMPPVAMHSLLDRARAADCIVLEDDYDGEFHHSSAATQALAAIDDLAGTIHVGTFSKSMFPGLRLAYMIVPHTLVDPIVRLRGLMDGQPSTPLQAAMAGFIRSGAFGRHLRDMRILYARRKQTLEASIANYCKGLLTPLTSDTGLHLCCLLPSGVDDTKLCEGLRQSGIGATALSVYAMADTAQQPGLVIGFGNTDEKHFDALIKTITKTVELALK
jgi:GntR family transcriptional regulator/MocR family aminotransferase